MIESSNLLVRRGGRRATQASPVHREPPAGRLSITRGRTRGSSIRALLVRASSVRYRPFGQIGAAGYDGALDRRDTLGGAPRSIPVSRNVGGGE